MSESTVIAEKIDRPGNRRRGREATERALIEAFDRVVRRGGLRTVGVNEVISEAGVGKALLYRYFGNLSGLVTAWGDAQHVWPDWDRLEAIARKYRNGDARVFVKEIIVFHAELLRSNPLAVELLAEQLMQPSPISEALEEIRKQLAVEYHRVLGDNPLFLEHRKLIRFMLGSVSYMAMRAAKAPYFMGANLSEDAGWDAMMEEFNVMIDAAMIHAGAQWSDATSSVPSR